MTNTPDQPTAGQPAADHLVDAPTAGAAVADGALLVDVRSAGGRASTGGLPQAVVVDKAGVDAAFTPGGPGALERVPGLGDPVVVVCGSPAGSGPVVERLRELGFSDVVHVEGGFGAWRDAGLPVTPPEPA